MAVSSGDQVAISAISLVEILYLEEKQKLPAGVLARVRAELATPGSALTGWQAEANSPVAPQVSDVGAYGFIASSATADGSAIPAASAADRAFAHRRSSTSGSRMWLPRSRRR